MAKVALTNIYLVNWYGFINTKIPIGRDLTLKVHDPGRNEICLYRGRGIQ